MAQEYLRPVKFENNFSSKNSQIFITLVKKINKQCVKMSFEVFPHVFLVFFRSSYVFLVVFRQTYIICLESTWLSPPMYQYRGDNNTTIAEKESATCQYLCLVLYGFLDLNPLWWVFSPFADDVNHLPGDPPLK